MAILYVVATPLGNLEDLTLRAIRVLGQAPVVAAESVSRARSLLAHLQIKGRKIISCRESNRRTAAQRISSCLRAGLDVALISDAGTPGLNDPAAAVVRQAVRDGFTVSPVPGPSAVGAAWSVAGIDHAPFLVLGFLPAQAGARKTLLREAQATGWPMLFFETPHRLRESAELLARIMPDRGIILCREMSKLHEQIVRATCGELAGLLQSDPSMMRGEFTLVVEGGCKPEPAAAGLEEIIRRGQGMPPSQLAACLAAAYGRPREEIYKAILRLRKPETE
ncbi:MAG: 16S rRNA (cytidine(1402)-2'-O)-methyltransferase [Desulfarculales bacterium]|jgi:16S rRNA (cytidine1402-2'-O)-methyltransferase|nr:16S rRNA (cytidine(1402)-2'-O)-methyltransferase [Desulfarculales bacterium]